jgi:DNA-binding XRE family transcriptional regulator
MVKKIPTLEVWPTPALIRAGRGLLGISQQELADSIDRHRKSVLMIENHVDEMMDTRRVVLVEEIASYLESQGIEFIRPRADKGAGVRLNRP